MAQGSDNNRLSASELGAAALTTVEELTGFQAEAITALEWDGQFWQVTVDALELSRIPNTTDVIGSYQIELDEQGVLHGYRRVRRYVRGQPSGE
jgi:hypothetical protein